MILLFYVLSPFAQGAADWRSGPQWSILSVLCPVHPFPLRGTSPKGETRDMREKTASHILQVPFRCVPLWWLAPPPFPRKRGHYKAPLCYELLMKGLLRGSLLSHSSAGGEGGAVKHQREESHRRWLITVVLTMPYDTESKSRNADFILIALRAIPQPSARRAVKLTNPPAHRAGPS